MKKYEVNRRYPFEEGRCPVDGEAVVTVWAGDESITSDRAKRIWWRGGRVTHFMVLEHPPEKKVRWVNVYGDGAGCFYKTREVADRYATRSRTECIRVEYTDGEGL